MSKALWYTPAMLASQETAAGGPTQASARTTKKKAREGRERGEKQ